MCARLIECMSAQGSERRCCWRTVASASAKPREIIAAAALAAIAVGANSAIHPRLPKAQNPSRGTTVPAIKNPTASHEGGPLRTLKTSRKNPAIPANSASGASKRATPKRSGSNHECLVTVGSSPSAGSTPHRSSIVGRSITTTPPAATIREAMPSQRFIVGSSQNAAPTGTDPALHRMGMRQFRTSVDRHGCGRSALFQIIRRGWIAPWRDSRIPGCKHHGVLAGRSNHRSC